MQDLFPSESEIPEEFKITETLEQRAYLVNGEMRQWAGQVQDVWSPVYMRTENGLEQKRIGSYPITEPADAMEALEAAVAAYKNGRGHWPTASITQRIECVERFTEKMVQKRDEVVKL